MWSESRLNFLSKTIASQGVETVKIRGLIGSALAVVTSKHAAEGCVRVRLHAALASACGRVFNHQACMHGAHDDHIPRVYG